MLISSELTTSRQKLPSGVKLNNCKRFGVLKQNWSNKNLRKFRLMIAIAYKRW